MVNKRTAALFLMINLIIIMQTYAASEDANGAEKDIPKKGIITAPAGLSLPATFMALHNAAKPIGLGHLDSMVNRTLRDDQHAMQVLLSRCPGMHCDYVGGRLMKVYFDKFPKELFVGSFDKQYGEGEAQRVLQEAATTSKKDDNHYSRDVCSYFRGVAKDDVDRDLLSTFERCQRLKKGEEEVSAFKAVDPSCLRGRWYKWILGKCAVSYTIRSGAFNRVPHQDVPCNEALAHMRRLENSAHAPGDWIEDMSFFSRSRFASFEPVSLSVAAEAIENALERAPKDAAQGIAVSTEAKPESTFEFSPIVGNGRHDERR